MELSASPRTPQDVGAWRIILILVAVMIALPAFATGAELAHALGALQAAGASFAGAAILAVVAAFTGAAGARARASTYELVQDAFGRQGAKLINGAIGASVIGWYGVVATMFASALASVAPTWSAHVPWWAFVAIACAATTATAMVGFRALNTLSAWTTPLKLALLFVAFALALQGGFSTVLTYSPASETPFRTGVSMVAGGLIVGAVLAPDICRFASSPRRAALGCAVAYGVCYPAVLLLAGLPSIAAGERDLVKIMLVLGLGVSAMLTVILTAWSTNSFNLYSATLVGATLAPKTPHWLIGLVAGLAGTVLALAGISAMLIPYLVWLSICIPPIAGVYLVQAWCEPRVTREDLPSWRPGAWLAWALGIAWGSLSESIGWTVTHVPAIDALLLSGLVTWAALRARGRLRRAAVQLRGVSRHPDVGEAGSVNQRGDA